MTLIDAIQNFAVDTGGYEHLLGSGWNYMATDQANYGMIAAWRYLNGMRSLYDMRPEFTEEQKEQIQSLKDCLIYMPVCFCAQIFYAILTQRRRM